eukprot:6196489-Pleurochrysis_carterae.AAC.7
MWSIQVLILPAQLIKQLRHAHCTSSNIILLASCTALQLRHTLREIDVQTPRSEQIGARFGQLIRHGKACSQTADGVPGILTTNLRAADAEATADAGANVLGDGVAVKSASPMRLAEGQNGPGPGGGESAGSDEEFCVCNGFGVDGRWFTEWMMTRRSVEELNEPTTSSSDSLGGGRLLGVARVATQVSETRDP